jgi:acyl-coenzyme A thioesterase PaaI-like protein
MSLLLSPSPRLVRWSLNTWLPLIGAGIRVRRVAPDFREFVVEMPLRRFNRNAFGSHFGGSLYAMTDPFFVLMLRHNLGPDYVVWDRAACIDYVAAGRSRVRAVLRLADQDLKTIRSATESGSKHLHLFHADVVDAEDLLVARIEKLIYVRRRRAANAADPNAPSGGPSLRTPAAAPHGSS